MPVVLRKTFLFAQEQPVLDAALVEMSAGARLLVLDDTKVAVYHQQGGRWVQDASLPVQYRRETDTPGRRNQPICRSSCGQSKAQ